MAALIAETERTVVMPFHCYEAHETLRYVTYIQEIIGILSSLKQDIEITVEARGSLV